MNNEMHSFRKLMARRGLYLRIGYIISLSLVILAFQWKSKDNTKQTGPNHDMDNTIYVMEEIPRTTQAKEKEIEVKDPDVKFVDLNKAKINETKDKKTDKQITTGKTDSNLIDFKFNHIFKPPDKDKPVKTTRYRVVEEMPIFNGGTEAMYKWIQKNISYPELERSMGIGGTVHLEFVVTRNGDITDVKILRGVTDNIDEEAVRVISSMPKWKPGKQGNKKVDVYFTIPIKFLTQ